MPNATTLTPSTGAPSTDPARASVDETQRLATLRRLSILDTPPEAAFDRITKLTASLFEVPISLISFVDEGRQWFKSRTGLDATETPRQHSFCARAIEGSDTLVVLDAANDPEFSDNPLVVGIPGIRFYAGAPLISAEGHQLGTLCAIDTKIRSGFDEKSRRTLESLAAIVMNELELRVAVAAMGNQITRHQSAETASEHARLDGDRLTNVLAQASVGMAVFDGEERLVLCNPAYWQLFNMPAEARDTRPTFTELMQHQVERELLPETRDSDETVKADWVRERVATFRNGTGTMTRQLSNGQWLNVQQQKLDSGETALFTADVTDLKRQEEALVQSNAELERFAYIASHDLQEPLRKIRTFTGMVQTKEKNNLSPEGGDLLARMEGSAARMQTLIQDLLNFSRAQKIEGDLKRVDLNKTMADVLSDLEERISETKADISVSELPVIEGDPVQMHQLMQNLLSNALKFHKSDTAPLVEITWTNPEVAAAKGPDQAPAAQWHEISVTDNGIGLDTGYANTIFQAFQRLHGRDEYPGSGVGLAVCRRIVERLFGSISVESAPGEGATFTVVLPSRQVVGERVNGSGK